MTTLLEAVQKAHNTLVNLSKLGNGNQVGNSTGNIIARDAAIELEQAIADERVKQCSNCKFYAVSCHLYEPCLRQHRQRLQGLDRWVCAGCPQISH